MKIIIPVAGVGSRLQPLTHTTPKPLLPVAGKPVLSHVINQIESLQPEEIIFVIGHLGHKIRTWVDMNVKIRSQCVEQSELLGLGYAVKLGLDLIETGPVMIVLGDTLVDADLKSFVSAGDNVIGVKKVENPQEFGVAAISNGKVIALVEKPGQPDSNLAAVGLYFLNDPRALKTHLEDILREGSRTCGEIQLTDGLNRLMADGVKFTPYEINNWYDCGNLEAMLAVNAHYLLSASDSRAQLAYDNGRFGEQVLIDNSAVIINSNIGPNVSIQADCQIKNSTLSNCIVDEGTKITDSTIKDSIVAKNCVINDSQIIAKCFN